MLLFLLLFGTPVGALDLAMAFAKASPATRLAAAPLEP